MAKTDIQWTDLTWNFLRGCSMVSAGCKYCYAMKMAHRFSGPGGAYEGLTELGPDGPRWTGKIRVVEEKLEEPLHVRKPQKWFVNSMSDLFHEDVPFEVIDKAFAVMALSRQHTFQVLTKRPERMREYMLNTDRDSPVGRMESYARSLGMLWKDIPSPDWPLKNVWLGVSVENQQTADERIPLLLETPAAVRFVSYEPAIGPVDFQRTLWNHVTEHAALRFAKEVDGKTVSLKPIFGLDWVIVGGESGAKARPFEVDWARDVVRQCREANVGCFVKQMGSNAQERNDRIADVWYYADGSDMDTEAVDGDSYRYQGMPVRLRLKDGHGGNPNEWAEDLRVRQFPAQLTS